MYAKCSIRKELKNNKVEIANIKNSKIENEYGKFFLRDVVDEIYRLAKLYAPIKTGFLRENIVINKINSRLYEIKSLASYSIYVHEMIFNRHERPTRAKYLEDAAYETINKYTREIYMQMEYEPIVLVRISLDPIT